MTTIQLSIAQPCDKNWTNMQPDKQGRFCTSCKKNVIDFSVMDSNEIYKTILNSHANICGRFNQAQLDVPLPQKAEKSSTGTNIFFSFLIPAFLFAKPALAQKKIGKIKATTTVCSTVTTGMVFRETFQKHFKFSGVVMDAASKEIIRNASVQLKERTDVVMTDSAGNFTLTAKTATPALTVIVSAIGFETKEIDMAIPADDFMVLNEIISLHRAVKLLGEVVIVGDVNRSRTGAMSTITRISRYTLASTRLITALNDSIKIYPNPVPRGTSFSVTLKLKQTGNYTLQVVDAAGKLLMQQQINIIGKIHQQNILCNEKLNSGIYFLRVAGYRYKLVANSRFVIK